MLPISSSQSVCSFLNLTFLNLRLTSLCPQIVKTFEAILYAADEREAKAAMAAVQEAPQENGTRASFEGLDIASESLEGLNLQQLDYNPSL